MQSLGAVLNRTEILQFFRALKIYSCILETITHPVLEAELAPQRLPFY